MELRAGKNARPPKAATSCRPPKGGDRGVHRSDPRSSGPVKSGRSCTSVGRNEDPVHCSVPTTLEFLQSLLDDGRCPATV
ncbi:hypothetical protein F7725_017443, partial [Dissostichus mawsoni]